MTATQSSAAATGGCTTCSYPKLAALVKYLDGLDHRADLAELTRQLSNLSITREDIASSCLFGQKGYKRNTIAASPWYELLAPCWRSGDFTPIHDHQGVSCAFKVVEGTGTEIRFEATPSGLVCPVQTIPMQVGYVCCANDPDIHQVANMQSPGKDLITLHIYSPPIKSMNTYQFATRVSEECSDKYKVAARSSPQGAEFPC